MSVQTERGIPLCTVNPRFLHTNSTSHTWSFSAIAELIDNAYDPDVKAKTFWIDKTRIGSQDCLTFIDNGAGMDFHKMYRMLGLGFSDKKTVRGHAPVGMYGNGFKSGSMHLGKDAIVFSKKGESMCVGMLSQTYLNDTQMEKVVVPIVTFKCIGESIHPEVEHKESLQAILRYSLFQTEEELHSEFKAITQDSSGSTGTRIIIWNLCKESEFDFETDHYDIQIPDVYEGEIDKYKRSLRAYCSILYLKPRMQIIVRGQIVKTELIAKSLAHAVTEKYIPSSLKDKRRSIPITFGFNPKSQEHYGVMMYHKNRLIKAYERVKCQNTANKKGVGVGVIAVIECNFLTPIHNKQDFNNTEEYRSTMKTLDKKLEEYWNVMYNKIGQNGTVPLENILEDPKQNWVQCDDCRKWRKLPNVTDMDKLPEKWFCRMNSDKRFRSCDEPEEREDSEDETYQQEKKNLKVQQKLKKQQMEEKKRNAEIKNLTRAEEKLFKELRQTAPFQLSLPTTSLTTDITAPIDFSAPLQSASSSSDNMQVTPHSLFTRTKRSLGQTNSKALKKKRALNDSPSTFTCTSDVLTSPMEITDNTSSREEVDSNTDDDDVVVIGETSKARPKAVTFNFDKVKLERSTSNDVPNNDDVCAAIESKPNLAEESDRNKDGTSPILEEPGMDLGLNIYDMATQEAQKQQDSLLELMEATAKEREEYKMQAQSLALKLKNKELHNEQLTKTINEMKKKQEEMLLQMKAEKEAQDRMKAEGAGHSATPNEDDEMAVQLDFLLRELDQRNTECNELKHKLNPKFLHTNSTSHTWPFSAIAELIDNAYDPDVSARQFWIDKTRIRDQDCLTFMDNGAGMDYNKMYKMLSFGFSDKETINGHVPIGLYGNGFKSGSMRLGKDAIVFSKKKDSMCVGMLSQTYLQKIQAENIVVPIVTFKRTGESIRPEPQHIESLQAILQYSLFQKEEELLAELEAINTHLSRDSTGTRIIIWNLRKTSTGKSEFDFEVNRYDIQIPADVFESEKEQYRQPCHVLQSSPESDFSLRAYCSVLYLKPRMQINIRGSKVKTQLIAKSLAHIVKDKYKPTFLNKERISITFGYNTKSKEHYGVMMYHKNRLIKSYERVGCQNKANNRGVGVIAVIECNFLKPTHNKQDFDYTDEYRRTITTLGLKLEEYWKAIRHAKGLNSTVPVEDIPKNPDQNWVQCDDCQKWRKLPDGIDTDKLPEKWFCRMNPVTEYRGCDKPEEAEDSEDETSTCLKEYKQHEKSLKRQQEQKKMQEQQRNAELAQQNEDLKRTQENLLRKLQQTGPSSPSTPTTSRAASTARSSVDSTPITRSSSSPLDNMPIITEVTSLSRFTRRKRSLGERSEGKALKKSRLLNDYCNNAPESPSTSAFISDLLTSQMEIPDDNNGSTDREEEESNTDDDDDIVIDETKSTPRPKTFNLAKVKLEKSTSNDVQYSDDVSMDTPTTEGSRNATTNPSTSNVSMTTQTESNMIVKMEDEIKEKDSDATGIECRKDKGTEINRSISEDSRCRSVDIDRKPSIAEGSDRSTGGRSPMPEEPAMDFGLNIYNMPTLEAQKQQDSLLELMEATAKEREEYKMQVQSLTLQLKDKECELLKLTVKKEFSHKNIQTDPLEEKDYKTLYLQATQRNEQLTKTINEMKKKQEEMLLQMKAEKEAQDRMKAEGAGHSATPNVDDEMALQVDFLLRELDQRNTECHELKIKVESLEQVKARCEQLQRDLDQLRKEKVECRNGPEKNRTDKASSTQTAQHNTVDGSANRENQIIENKETNENTAGGENTETNAKLRQLRSSVARLLVTFVPALDPEQVNYDCEVIDEILNQVIQEISPTLTTST